MCRDFRTTKLKKVIGYKIVLADFAERGRYRSLYTGNLYPKRGLIPIGVHQRSSAIVPGFLPNDSIVHQEWVMNNRRRGFWSPQMVGRTAIYADLDKAKDVLETVFFPNTWDLLLTVVKCRLSVDLLQARWNNGRVYCGRKLEILEESYHVPMVA